jgi:Flp pilus assembly pilin Flp
MSMKQIVRNLWLEDDGVLSFEWTIMAVVVVFGIVGGLAAARDAVIDELGDLGQSLVSIDQSYSFTGIPAFGILGASYVDIPSTVDDSKRQTTTWGIPPRNDLVGGG